MKHVFKSLKEYGFNTENRAYVIAEIGINHGGSLDAAKRLIDSASEAGVDAVKFQTYITEKRVSKNSPIFGILKKCQLPLESFREIKNYAQLRKVDFISTPFDEESIACLKEIECDIYKVASFDLVNHKLLSSLSKLNKTIIMSAGMADLGEIQQAYKILNPKKNKIVILYCVSAYPTKEEDANLAAIYTLKDKFDCIIGHSDHTDDIVVPLYAVAAGAQIIEKHYKLDANMDCADSAISITQVQMAKLTREIERLGRIIGQGAVGPTLAQKACMVYRRRSKKT